MLQFSETVERPARAFENTESVDSELADKLVKALKAAFPKKPYIELCMERLPDSVPEYKARYGLPGFPQARVICAYDAPKDNLVYRADILILEPA